MYFFYLLLFPCLVSSSLISKFDEWSEKHGQVYFNDDVRQHVFKNWVSNHKHIEYVNSRNLTYTLAHNKFSGMSSEEFSQYVGSFQIVNDLSTEMAYESQPQSAYMETSVNWVDKGAVTPVKDQGQCGSCWSFSTTGALEGAYYIKYGELIEFSEQQLVDCDNFKNGGTDHGCNGGLMDNAFTWIKKNGGLCLEKDYPYTSGTTRSSGTCEDECAVVDNSKVVSFYDVSKSSDDAMMQALSKQPVSIAIQADQKDFQLYKSGVFTGECGTQLDHGVLAVGYGTEKGEDYYLVKNSWSEQWGDGGYIKLGRGSQYNKGEGQCGMLLSASYPNL